MERHFSKSNESGSIMIYLLIIIGMLSIITMGGASTIENLSGLTNRDRVRFDTALMADTIVQLYQNPANCQSLIQQQALMTAAGQAPTPTLFSEYQNLAAGLPASQSVTVIFPLNNMPAATPTKPLLSSTMNIGIAPIRYITVANYVFLRSSPDPVIPTFTNSSARVDLQVFMAPTISGYVAPPMIIPFYIYSIEGNVQCQATAYVATNQTVEDLVCSNKSPTYSKFDPSGASNLCF